MQVFDFFSGIGGFSLAAEWMGWDVVSHCEIDKYCQKILKKHWPDVYLHEDIKTYNYEAYQMARGTSTEQTIFTGGFPCQPASTAGKRKGTSDNRWLWPEYFRVISEIKPTYVVGENVPGILSLEDGRVFDGICSDLESAGYQVESYLIPACGVGTWHRRERVWIIAYTKGNSDRRRFRTGNESEEKEQRSKNEHQNESERFKSTSEILPRDNSRSPNGILSHSCDSSDRANRGEKGKKEGVQGECRETGRSGLPSGASSDDATPNPEYDGQFASTGKQETERVEQQSRWAQKQDSTEQFTGSNSRSIISKNVPYTRSKRLEGSKQCENNEIEISRREESAAGAASKCCSNGGRYWSTEPRLGDLVDGIPSWMVEPDIPRVLTGVKDRVNKLKGLGNAIVPQVAFEIFQIIEIHRKMQ